MTFQGKSVSATIEIFHLSHGKNDKCLKKRRFQIMKSIKKSNPKMTKSLRKKILTMTPSLLLYQKTRKLLLLQEENRIAKEAINRRTDLSNKKYR